MQSKTDRRMCGTCEYWTGLRQPIFVGNGIPKVNIIDKTGSCECSISNFEGQSRQCEKACKNYSKWTELF